MSIQIRSHIFQDSCWVCDKKFGPSLKEERHHLIPRAYGGTDGPQVSLCDSHHTALHNIALRLYSQRTFTDLLTHDKKQDERIFYMANTVYRARLLTENDPNKKRVEVIPLSAETFEKLKKLKTIHPVSRPKLIEAAINQMYSRYFK